MHKQLRKMLLSWSMGMVRPHTSASSTAASIIHITTTTAPATIATTVISSTATATAVTLKPHHFTLHCRHHHHRHCRHHLVRHSDCRHHCSATATNFSIHRCRHHSPWLPCCLHLLPLTIAAITALLASSTSITSTCTTPSLANIFTSGAVLGGCGFCEVPWGLWTATRINGARTRWCICVYDGTASSTFTAISSSLPPYFHTPHFFTFPPKPSPYFILQPSSQFCPFLPAFQSLCCIQVLPSLPFTLPSLWKITCRSRNDGSSMSPV
ncbi:hypothetical protein Vretimale_12355 [Volvox reticuliferus]|uniref:Uncharacterized protein n=1 Tax=Volvox reticuliferus TaxID=1737510 RepID=A0A8J4LSM8_9CHLO|nr:hypothetical protein Vretimale_12355 [Volvox reticuliferus]